MRTLIKFFFIISLEFFHAHIFKNWVNLAKVNTYLLFLGYSWNVLILIKRQRDRQKQIERHLSSYD